MRRSASTTTELGTRVKALRLIGSIHWASSSHLKPQRPTDHVPYQPGCNKYGPLYLPSYGGGSVVAHPEHANTKEPNTTMKMHLGMNCNERRAEPQPPEAAPGQSPGAANLPASAQTEGAAAVGSGEKLDGGAIQLLISNSPVWLPKFSCSCTAGSVVYSDEMILLIKIDSSCLTTRQRLCEGLNNPFHMPEAR